VEGGASDGPAERLRPPDGQQADDGKHDA
jgi:hypothetical protein